MSVQIISDKDEIECGPGWPGKMATCRSLFLNHKRVLLMHPEMVRRLRKLLQADEKNLVKAGLLEREGKR